MAESKTRRPVKLIRGGQESRAVVEHPHRKPWSVVEHVSKDERAASVGVRWEVVIFLPSDREPDPLVFESREEAWAWTAKDHRAEGFNWHAWDDPPDDSSVSDDVAVERSNAATARLYEFAKKNDLDPNSQQAFDLARKEEVIGSFTLYELRGCQGRCQVVESYLGDWSKLGMDWTPKSCRGSQGAVYEVIYGWANPGSKFTPVRGGECRDDVPHEVRAVKVEH